MSKQAAPKRKKPDYAPREKTGRLTQAERTSASDSRMIESAIELLSAHGTHNTTLKEVGERAGYSRGLASERYGSKEGLFNAVLDAFGERWDAASADAISDRTGLDALRADINAVRDFTISHPHDVRAAYIITYETIASSELIRSRLSAQHRAYHDKVARWIEQEVAKVEDGDVDCGSVALHYLAGLFGITYLWLIDPRRNDIGKELDRFRESFFAYLKVIISAGR